MNCISLSMFIGVLTRGPLSIDNIIDNTYTMYWHWVPPKSVGRDSRALSSDFFAIWSNFERFWAILSKLEHFLAMTKVDKGWQRVTKVDKADRTSKYWQYIVVLMASLSIAINIFNKCTLPYPPHMEPCPEPPRTFYVTNVRYCTPSTDLPREQHNITSEKKRKIIDWDNLEWRDT